MRTTAQETGVERWRGTEQVHQQPAVTTEITDQCDVGKRLIIAVSADKSFGFTQQRPELFRQGEVVVNPGDALHGLAVPQGQTLAIDVLELTDVGGAVIGDRDVFLGRQRARHRWTPQVLVAEFAVGKTVNLVQARQRVGRVGQGGRDEFQQRLGVVGGDLFVGQRGTQGFGVRRLRQATFAGHAQAFTFDTVQALLEQREVSALAEQSQAAVEKFAQFGFLHASVAPIWGWAGRSTRVKLKLAFSPGFVAAGHLPVSQELHNPCGSELAREEGLSAKISVA
ncbi:hypothetical protein PS619_06308 [Pseudomonas fluorescens]|nr:hypothetical protein PS619_06308 [Pseudomonas fluorescens]